MKNNYLEQYRRDNLRAAQLKMLRILEAIDEVCRKHGIAYWIEGGTLLGAMRHGGFIPWDDDLDISMLRKDYDRFISVAANELPTDLFLQTRQTDPEFTHRECKVRDLNSYIADGDDDNNRHYEKGIFVDVFPYDEGPSHCKRIMGKVARSICIADVNFHKVHRYSWHSMLSLVYFGIKRPLCKLVWKSGCILSADGNYLAIDPYFSWCRAIHPKENILPLTTVEFEGKTFPAPARPDEYLTTLYGNWRQIPPKDKQQIHSMIIVPELVKRNEK